MNRKVWLDNVKFIAMILVVIYHTPPRYDTATEALLFNMGAPVFFFAAGYVFNIAKQKDFLSFMRHRARQILVPYTTFFIIFYALWLAVGRRMAGPEEMAIDTLTPVWQFIGGRPEVVLGPFWFLACLFSMQLIYYPIKRYLPGWWPLIAGFLLGLSLLVLPNLPWLRYWNIDRALLYMPIYAVGNNCRQLADKVSFDNPWRTLLWIALACASFAFLSIAPFHWDKDLAYVLAPFAVILVLPLYTAVCKSLEASPAVCRVGHVVAITSITYLAIQNYLIGIIKILFAKFMGETIFDDNILLKIAVALIVMIVLYPIAIFIDRHLPWLLGKKSPSL